MRAFKTPLKSLFGGAAKIENLPQYREFLYDQSTRAAGGLVLSYSQKRAGKLHFRLAKERAYADDLIRAQIGLHAEIASDLWFLTLEFLKLPRPPLKTKTQTILTDLHQRYVDTAPRREIFNEALKPQHFNPTEKGLKAFADKSGDVLFALLPFTDDLLAENRNIFRGQLRLRYISFLEKLDKRSDMPTLCADLRNHEASRD